MKTDQIIKAVSWTTALILMVGFLLLNMQDARSLYRHENTKIFAGFLHIFYPDDLISLHGINAIEADLLFGTSFWCLVLGFAQLQSKKDALVNTAVAFGGYCLIMGFAYCVMPFWHVYVMHRATVRADENFWIFTDVIPSVFRILVYYFVILLPPYFSIKLFCKAKAQPSSKAQIPESPAKLRRYEWLMAQKLKGVRLISIGTALYFLLNFDLMSFKSLYEFPTDYTQQGLSNTWPHERVLNIGRHAHLADWQLMISFWALVLGIVTLNAPTKALLKVTVLYIAYCVIIGLYYSFSNFWGEYYSQNQALSLLMVPSFLLMQAIMSSLPITLSYLTFKFLEMIWSYFRRWRSSKNIAPTPV